MFDAYARSLFSDFPEFEGLLADNAMRALSKAYLAVIEHRINGSDADVEQLAEVQPFLRRLANTLIFHVVLDEERETTERQAAGFVAAEAIALIADYLAAASEENNTSEANAVRSAERFARFESSLLYLFARYDACAAGVVGSEKPTLADNAPLVDVTARWCFERLTRLCRLILHPAVDNEFSFDFSASEELNPLQLEEDTIARLYVELGIAVNEFCVWLVGTENALTDATGRLRRVINALSEEPVDEEQLPFGYEFSRIFHLSMLLELCFPSLGERALVHTVPSPLDSDSDQYRRYLIGRAVGNDDSGSRPVLWPSAYEYVQECVLGDSKHCVAAMPTGSGKSFVAELAVSQAVQGGWVLYLAPTNALTEQIRGDLRKGLKALNTEIFAFIGDQEYSIFTAERVDQMPNNSVAVMTPEKCALALRLSPEAFQNCRLVVFDECHLLGDIGSTRGPVAELVLAQLILRAEKCQFLLMSAIVQNPEELAEWLSEATGKTSQAVSIRWRPTRTLRAVLGVGNKSVQERAPEAIVKLKSRAEKFKRASFTAECALAVNLQGAWQSEKQDDYSVTRISCDAPLKVLRRKTHKGWRYSWEGDSWVNKCAISLATKLAESGIQTLVFTPASKHYPFNNGSKVKLKKVVLDELPPADYLVDVCRVLAEFELGAASEVFALLDNGVAVHTSLMLETEKIGSELMFRLRGAPIMFATGTLAQGLNLPAIAVVIAGSRIGDPRGEAQEDVQRRKFSQLLNAAGRAGRAGFANQGVVIAVPDTPVAFDDFDSVKAARSQVDYLQMNDGSVRVESGLTGFLDAVCADALRSDQADEVELQVMSLLAGGDDNQIEPERVLRRTYAAYLRRKRGQSEVTEVNGQRLLSMGTEFIKATGAPEWLTIAAQRAGLDFFLALAIWHAWERIRGELPPGYSAWNVPEWRDEYLKVVAHIPPGQLTNQVSADALKKVSEEFKEIAKENVEIFVERDLSWKPPKKWLAAWRSAEPPLNAWMAGRSLAEIASIITGEDLDEIATDRIAGKPIPRALAVAQDAWSSLALIAGGFLAIAEQRMDGDVPLSLASLPMCIKYGCDSPGALAWFRFGVRLRRPSRLLAERFAPPELATDDELKTWVRQSRRDWLNTEMEEDDVFSAIKGFIISE
ncbi:DEAD/DEAH box helicase [Symmachiella dynata]|uniref:DEAD/DEAH box helicase n=1 Tax=Symmachiella dynata TaxID=2527995 RepID=UPI0030EBEE7B